MNLDQVKLRMQKVLEVLHNDLATVRTGRAMPSLVDNIIVSVYGGSTRLKVMELATIGTSDPQTLLITPFDASIINEIQKGIQEANVGLTPVIDGSGHIRISIPPLSEERRQQLIHLMKQKLENGRVMIRQVRQEAMQEIKKSFDKAQDHGQHLSEDEASRLEKEAQKLTDDTMSQIDAMGKRKEEELLQI